MKLSMTQSAPPFHVNVIENQVTEAHWRIIRERCRYYGCKKWEFGDNGLPIWPKDCSEECRSYIYAHVFGGEE